MNEIAPNLRAKINFSKIVWMIFVWVSEYGWTFERHTRCRVEVVNYINMWVWVRRSDCSCFRSYDVDSTFARIRGWKRKKRKTKKYLSQHFVVPLSKHWVCFDYIHWYMWWQAALEHIRIGEQLFLCFSHSVCWLFFFCYGCRWWLISPKISCSTYK